jgi:hypothetical protein
VGGGDRVGGGGGSGGRIDSVVKEREKRGKSAEVQNQWSGSYYRVLGSKEPLSRKYQLRKEQCGGQRTRGRIVINDFTLKKSA